MHLNVHSSFIYSSQDMEAAEVYMKRWMDKEVVVCIYSAVLALKKNEIASFAVTWMDLETIILSEVTQKGKDKYYMISLICVW